jgi:hypothetical protein
LSRQQNARPNNRRAHRPQGTIASRTRCVMAPCHDALDGIAVMNRARAWRHDA